VKNVSLQIPERGVVSLVGSSGCGKSTLLRCFNRMNDLREEARVEGEVLFRGKNIYGPGTDPFELRRQIGMVFQRANPFPTSVFENVAFGPRVNGYEGDLSTLVERSLKEAALWDEVNDRLFEPASALSAGQRQQLCFARALAVGPEVLLMDEPTSELDPAATRRMDALIHRLKERYTLVLVTYDMLQAARVSDYTAFIHEGELVEYGPTDAIFTNPKEPETEAYVTGRLG
jgi:phosphate transport system ATP-binding protein